MTTPTDDDDRRLAVLTEAILRADKEAGPSYASSLARELLRDDTVTVELPPRTWTLEWLTPAGEVARDGYLPRFRGSYAGQVYYLTWDDEATGNLPRPSGCSEHLEAVLNAGEEALRDG
jgi:hypothetical protein